MVDFGDPPRDSHDGHTSSGWISTAGHGCVARLKDGRLSKHLLFRGPLLGWGLAAPGEQPLELALMRRVGQRQPAGETPCGAARQLAGVEHDRRDLARVDSCSSLAPDALLLWTIRSTRVAAPAMQSLRVEGRGMVVADADNRWRVAAS